MRGLRILKDICSKCNIKKLCKELPDDLSCDDVKMIAEQDKSSLPEVKLSMNDLCPFLMDCKQCNPQCIEYIKMETMKKIQKDWWNYGKDYYTEIQVHNIVDRQPYM